jgi:sodium/proline symporter
MVDVDATIVTTMVLYLLGMIGVGVWMYRRTHNLDDFVLGGRSLGTVPAALSAQASDMSGWLLLGLPGAIYAAGLGEAWIGIGLLIGTYLNWKLVASRLRTYTERAGNSVTLSAYFENRFEDKTRMLRLVSAWSPSSSSRSTSRPDWSRAGCCSSSSSTSTWTRRSSSAPPSSSSTPCSVGSWP